MKLYNRKDTWPSQEIDIPGSGYKYIIYNDMNGDLAIYEYVYMCRGVHYYRNFNKPKDSWCLTHIEIKNFIKLNKHNGAYLEGFENLYEIQSKYFEYFL